MPHSERMLTPDSKIGLTFSNLIALAGIIAAAVVAWQKIPSGDDVQRITLESIKQASAAAGTQGDAHDVRMQKLEQQSAQTNAQLQQLSKRLDYVLIIMAGSAADIDKNPRSRAAAERVRRNLRMGDDPLAGLPLDE